MPPSISLVVLEEAVLVLSRNIALAGDERFLSSVDQMKPDRCRRARAQAPGRHIWDIAESRDGNQDRRSGLRAKSAKVV